MTNDIDVLVVDDDRAIRETLRSALEDEGYNVIEAADGLQALSVVRGSARPLVVLLDLRMPVLDGISVIEAVAPDSAITSRHAFAIVTANLDQVPQAKAATHGRLNIPVIAKPFDLDEVLDLVARSAVRLSSDHHNGNPASSPLH